MPDGMTGASGALGNMPATFAAVVLAAAVDGGVGGGAVDALGDAVESARPSLATATVTVGVLVVGGVAAA